MISKDELKEYAKIRGLNLGQAERDYFQNILLFILYQHYGRSLIFKGGTALSKCYGSSRFSEDLDFTCLETFNTNIIRKGLERFRVEFEIKTKEYEVGMKIILYIKGPLYTGIRYTLCRIVIDVSLRENVILSPVIKTIGRFMEEIPEFDVFVMQEKEILAEKIRAILTRSKARDIYDLWFLLRRGVEFDLEVIKKKLEYYDMRWDRRKFIEAVRIKSEIWNTELKPLIRLIPKLSEVKKLIYEKIVPE